MRANLMSISEEPRTITLTIKVDRVDYTEVPKGEVEISIKKYRDKRSTLSNNYYQHLLREIASVLDASRDEVNNLLLSRYGRYMTDDDGRLLMLSMPDGWDYMKSTDIHAEPTGEMEERDGKIYHWYRLLVPSHELDSQAFAKLVTGALNEARELGIDTIKPYELRGYLADEEINRTR